MPTDQIGFFVVLIQAFKDTLASATQALYPWAFYLFGAMAGLEVARVCLGLVAHEEKLAPALINTGLKFGAVAYLLQRWEYFFTLMTAQGLQLGLLAGGNNLSKAQFLNPGAYFELGAQMGDLLFQQWNRSAIGTIGQMVVSPFMTTAYFVAWLLFLIAFVLLAAIVLMFQIKLAFCVPAMLTILPFLVWKGTAWLAQGIFSYTAKAAYHFFMLALTASIAFPIATLITAQEAPDIRQAMLLVGDAGLLVACFLMVPGMAKDIMSGVFTMGAGSLASAAFLSSSMLSTATKVLTQLGRAVVGAGRGLAGNFAGGRAPGGGSGGFPSVVRVSPPPAASPRLLQAGLRSGAQYLRP